MSITHKIHDVKIHELENESFLYLIKCSCGHEARCNSHQAALQLQASHLDAQASLRYTAGMRQGGI